MLHCSESCLVADAMEEVEFLVSSLEQTLGVVVAGGDVPAVAHHTAAQVYSPLG